MDRADLQDYAYDIAQNIINNNYDFSSDNSDIIFLLNNETLKELIMAHLEDNYGEGTQAEAVFNEFIRYNRDIIDGNNNNEYIIRGMDNIIIDDNNIRPPTPPTPRNVQVERTEIPQEVIDRIPQEVLNVITCPISGEIMKNPVINSVGQTYDKENIQQWISRGNRTDPNTRQQITTTLIPNFSIKSLINSYIPQLGGKRKY